ncbi:MAG: phosphoribosylglycinamide formyltransferase [Flavobacterium sp.]|nr:MAG: phosphoribosylglycinamide formyltransferase [Flavobacterium sp.]
MKNIVLFASGGGSNAGQIMQYFESSENYRVAALFTNNPNAGAIGLADKFGVPSVLFNRVQLEGGEVLAKLRSFNPALVVLAGFLWKMPSEIVAAFPDKIVNIHPALLPKYGGKGMYGINVHRAVLENKETESGITIHYVNEHYDEGNIIAQHRVALDDCSTPEDIARKVLAVEHEYYARVIEEILDRFENEAI